MSQDGAKYSILIIDDDPEVLRTSERLLKFEGYPNVVTCDNPRLALDKVTGSDVGVIVLDLVMPEMHGEELLPRLREKFPSIPVIVVTGANDIDQAVRCMKAGAFDYVPKSAEASRYVSSVKHAARIHELEQDYGTLKKTMLGDNRIPQAFSDIVTRDPKMFAIFRYCETVVSGAKPVLISGESGTGKELMAYSLHKASGRSGEFVPLNIAGLDDNMLSDTLFGHKRGAFTGADSDRRGVIDKAREGTLFLDEIGDLSPQNQIKLLRLIEDRRYYPVGSDVQKQADVLLLTATNRDLAADCRTGRFRADLYFRLETHHVKLPPLRERKVDIPLLVEHFLEKAAKATGAKPVRAPRELYALLETWSFPGNVRELESLVFDAVGQCDGAVVSLDVFLKKLYKNQETIPVLHTSCDPLDHLLSNLEQLPTLKGIQDALVEEALSRSGYNQGIAAAMLGITRSALNKRINKKDDDGV